MIPWFILLLLMDSLVWTTLGTLINLKIMSMIPEKYSDHQTGLGTAVLYHMKKQISLSLALNHNNLSETYIHHTRSHQGLVKGLGPHLPFPPQFTLRIYPTLLQGFGADQVHTQDIPFVQYLHLPDSWLKSFLYRFYFTDECRENHCFFLLPRWWVQHQGQSNQPVCKRGSSTLRYELVILWPHLPSEMQLSCHL